MSVKKRIVVIISGGILAIGLLSGFTYARSSFNSMIKVMQDNGFAKPAQYMKDKDYKAMDNYMDNITDEDYSRMTDAMRQNGYGDMADAMQSIGKGNMIKMHNTSGGAAGMMR
jgi:hypothetical protein